jgi:hypothetical protein
MARVKNEENTYNLEINCNYQGTTPCAPLVFNGKAKSSWSDEIEWLLIDDKDGRELESYTQNTQAVHKMSDRSVAVLWAGSKAPFMENRELFLGGTYGFVDFSVSLLALEEDTLGAEEQMRWENEGVPLLAEKDILAVDTGAVDNLVITLIDPVGTQIIMLDGVSLSLTPEKVFSLDNLKVNMIRDGAAVLKLMLPESMNGIKELIVSIYNINGKKIKTWTLHKPSSGNLQLQAPGLKPGFYLIRLQGETFNLTKRIVLN